MDMQEISRNESSFRVAALHQALSQLGLAVARGEQDHSLAGADTLEKVRAFQQQRGITPRDGFVADMATLNALTDALRQGGKLDDSRAFTVRGTVRGADGQGVKGVQVLAFDLDLRGAALHRKVRTLAEMQDNGGFEFLGSARSDAEGRYAIKFYDWQYRNAERKKADVVAFAVDAGKEKDKRKEKGAILGRSRMALTEDFSADGQVSGLDIVPDAADPRTEYAALMQALEAFLAENKVAFADIAGNADQLRFTAGELDLDGDRLELAAQAQRLLATVDGKFDPRAAHEMLYGIGRQQILLALDALQRKSEEELKAALARSAQSRIVAAANPEQLSLLLKAIRSSAAHAVLEDTSPRRATLNAMLQSALPKATQRSAFLEAVASFAGGDARAFWSQHLPAQPEFRDQPGLIARLQLTQQLTQLTLAHTPLVQALLEERKVASIEALFELETEDWQELVRKTGVPEAVPGADEAERARAYVQEVQNLLNASFPTRRIAQMVRGNQLPIEKTRVGNAIHGFLKKAPHFDIARSPLHRFERELREAAQDQYPEARAELAKIQRTFQVSPSPEAMAGLMEHQLTSATAIAAIPRKNFMDSYGDAVGGAEVAYAIHQRATQVAARSETTAMRILDYTQGYAPNHVLGIGDIAMASEALANHIPNYAELFGSPDLCECEQCRSVYGAAAYFVDLLRFLWRGDPNASGDAPLELLKRRRPDLLHLPLTCENTNTIVPYIDLANEVMEHYAAHGSLTGYEGHDTGEATAQELRANPQNFELQAYRNIKDARYPFSLPYHQPLDTIRVFGEHLKASRHDLLRAIHPQPDATQAQAIAAEALKLSQEEYRVLTGEGFEGTADATPLHACYGLAGAGELESLRAVREFMRRTGVAYTELVEIVKTRFVNPHQGTLDFLQALFSHGSIDANLLYVRLVQVEAGTLDPATDAGIVAAINGYNAARGTSVTAAQLASWVDDHLAEFRQVLTLYQPDSHCDLDTTELRTIQRVYEGGADSGVGTATWTRLHRFIRLWRKLGLTVHETDLLLTALGESDITPELIARLEPALQLKARYKLAASQLAVFWGAIDAHGDKSLYRKLFLNKAVQQIDSAFAADAWGDYLQDAGEMLGDHLSAILAAFRIGEDDLQAILGVARVVDGGAQRAIAPATDALDLGNLSTVYRYVLLAKALKMKVADLCTLVQVSGAAPFSLWDVQAQAFGGIAPQATADFIAWAAATKDAGFKAPVLQYIVQGALPAGSSIGLAAEKVTRTVTAIRAAFTAIEQDHPDAAPAPLTAEALHAKLSLSFDAAIATRLLAILSGTAVFEAMAASNLDVAIPEALAARYTYVKASGRLLATGVMSDAEQAALKALANTSAAFDAAVDALHDAPGQFLADHFGGAGGVFADLAEARRMLLDQPAQVTPATPDERLAYVYAHYLPVLKTRLRRDAITQHLASLVGLGEAATAVLIEAQVDDLVAQLSTEGFSARYFSDAAWTTAALARTDATIDFDWGSAAPDPLVPASNFSVRWQADIAAPATGEYTLVVSVDSADESFRLSLDGALVLEKAAADASLAWEAIANLNAAQLHRLVLEYANTAPGAGIRLQWKRAARELETVPAGVAYPADIVDGFAGLATTLHRAARFIATFKLNDAEVGHLVAHAADFGNIDFAALDTGDWQRVHDYLALRNASPQVPVSLVDLFAAAGVADPAPTVAGLKALLCQATAWDPVNVDYLVDTHFALAVADFRNEIALNRVRAVMDLALRTGLSAETLAQVGAVQTDFDALHAQAQLLKNTVKARYDEGDWLQLAGDLSDKLRRNQQQALIAYLLTRPAIRAWGATDADSLFEYFLIDVQMGACMDTSRIVQANASVQMFVSRCLLNLESDLSTGVEQGVSPAAIDRERWEWMKNYRVWEANRKVFLYPENWLEPEWRNDRSEFFRDLESFLVQNDINESSVEQAFRNYLSSLDEVANLEVCGLHRENHDDGSLKFLHVFARSHAAPYKFFYRRWNEYRKWTPWEKMNLDIRMVEKGSSGGVQLLPVVWKKRLFLFWPEFSKVDTDPGTTGSKTAENAAKEPLSTFKAKSYYEVRLGYSEYVDGKWAPKKLTKEFIEERPDEGFQSEKDLLFKAAISPSTQQLVITALDEYWNMFRGSFVFDDIQSPVTVHTNSKGRWVTAPGSGYDYFYSDRKDFAPLQLESDTYLRNSTTHRLLPVDTQYGLNLSLADPFFFKEGPRSYFVRPVDITIVEWVRNPDIAMPYLPGLVDDSGWMIPEKLPIPELGPDDYFEALPQAGFVPKVDGGSPVLFFGASVETGEPVLLADDYAGAAEVPLPAMAGAAAPRAMRAMGQPLPMMAALDAEAAILPAMRAAPEHGEALAVPMATMAPATTMLAQDIGYASAAFGGMTGAFGRWSSQLRFDRGLEFHTFHHPYSARYVESLNRGGVPGLMASDTTLPSDGGTLFEGTYDPNFAHGFVQKPADFALRTYYKQNVCFDVYGANSCYNWELFFHAPLYIATRLSRNGQYEQAMKWFHHIFDPTTDAMPAPGESETARYWNVLPFRSTPQASLADWFRSLGANNDPAVENATIAEWRDNPFDPHLVAANRPLAYMKHVVVKYVENLLAWGDSLFRQDTMESVNEALQIYVIASHILGPRPEFVPGRGEVKAESYQSLQARWDDFSNALVELENIFPYSSETFASDSTSGSNLLGVGPALYFCIPPNDKLLDSWDTVADRLYKIRHCQNIDGVFRKLALFAPPIDPGALVQAASQGLSLGSILADLSSPPPIYRFTHLVAKANEFCADVRSLGSALLAALEKKDGEELAHLRATHEVQMQNLVTAVKERQVLDARSNQQQLEKARESTATKLRHYLGLLGNDTVTIPAAPSISATLTADSALPADTSIPTIANDVDVSLVEGGEAGVKVIPREQQELLLMLGGQILHQVATISEGLAGTMNFIPNFSAQIEPFGCGASISYGGSNIAGGISGLAKIPAGLSDLVNFGATMAGKMAGFIRREQEWTFQANLAAREIIQVDKQITSAQIRVQVAEKELANHLQSILNAQQVEQFLANKFSSQELYQWMKEQLFAVYKQSYNLAYEMAKKAENAYRHELGEQASFIQYGYWDTQRQGLLAADKLQLALRQLEKSYLDGNRRELELVKSVSLARLDPLALIALRETGRCYVRLPEELFDLDFQGHYYRRIRNVRLSLPCIAGPYTSVNCSLRLMNNAIRTNTAMNSAGGYEHENDEGVWIDDDRFRVNHVPVTAIATSSAQADAGMFEFDFRDERYLPFEYAGAISEWQIELATDEELRQFDYSTISDVVLHVGYTARESGGLFRQGAVNYLKDFIANAADRSQQPLMQMFSLRHEFPTEWYRFLHPAAAGGEQRLTFTPARSRFPFFAQDRGVTVMRIDVLARSTASASYHLRMSYTSVDEDVVESTQVALSQVSAYGDLHQTGIDATDAGLNLEELDVDRPVTLRLKRTTAAGYTALATQPDELDDVMVVLHYRLG